MLVQRMWMHYSRTSHRHDRFHPGAKEMLSYFHRFDLHGRHIAVAAQKHAIPDVAQLVKNVYNIAATLFDRAANAVREAHVFRAQCQHSL